MKNRKEKKTALLLLHCSYCTYLHDFASVGTVISLVPASLYLSGCGIYYSRPLFFAVIAASVSLVPASLLLDDRHVKV
jgi:hypothetical protein